MIVQSLCWDWESSQETPKVIVEETNKNHREEMRRIHPSLPIVMSGDYMTCKADDANLFWLLTLMSQGGFLHGSLSQVSKQTRLEIAKKAIERENDMKLIPIGQKERQKEYHDCLKLLMTDVRIPVWNPLFLRILVGTSNLNVIRMRKNTEVPLESFAVWKQRVDCLLLHETDQEWMIETATDAEVKERYPLSCWVSKKKTERTKMSKDRLYIICTIFELYPTKITKKDMLEKISTKLT